MGGITLSKTREKDSVFLPATISDTSCGGVSMVSAWCQYGVSIAGHTDGQIDKLYRQTTGKARERR
jgi:hypothetical protein